MNPIRELISQWGQEKVAIKKAMEPIVKKQIKDKEHRRKSGDSVDSSESGETRQKVAQFVDTSFDTLNKLEHIVEVFRGPKPQVMKVLSAP